MRKSFSRASKRKMHHWLLTTAGVLALTAAAAINPDFAVGEMQISEMTMFRENASSTCVPFAEQHKNKENYVQYEANLFKDALYESRTFREIAAEAGKAGLNIDYICHDGSQFRPSSLDLAHSTLTINLLREEQNRPYEALLATHYLFRMRAAELHGVARNAEFTPESQIKAYMVEYADAMAWTGLAAVEKALENGADTGPEFEIFKQRFPGPAAAVTAALAKMPRDGQDHYDEMKQAILTAGFMAGMADDVSRSWVANNGLPKWLSQHLLENPDIVEKAGTREFSTDDVQFYGRYLKDLDVIGMYDRLYGALDNDPAADGLAEMQAAIDFVKTPHPVNKAHPSKTPVNSH